jgi:two-component system, cell cycle response regulator
VRPDRLQDRPSLTSAAEPEAQGRSPMDSERLRILVVDDETTIRTVIGQVLQMDGHDPTLAASGEEALALFRQQPFPLVFTDVIMGQMNGLTLLREIKQIDDKALVVIMTSHASLETAMTALRAGAYDFLVKPFEDLFLLSVLAQRAQDRVHLERRNDLLVRQIEMHVGELERLNQELKQSAEKDGLTGLFNRRYLWGALDTEISRARRHRQPLSLIMLDLDYFKTYNDTHGHLAGDDLLIQVGRILMEAGRQEDVCARYGGEEFVVLLPATDLESARAVAERIRTRIAQHEFLGRHTQPGGAVTASLGIVTLIDADADGDAIIDRADHALYRAKELGRNSVQP